MTKQTEFSVSTEFSFNRDERVLNIYKGHKKGKIFTKKILQPISTNISSGEKAWMGWDFADNPSIPWQ